MEKASSYAFSIRPQQLNEDQSNEGEPRKCETDVETDLWRYSPLVSSASEDDFYEVLRSQGSVIRDKVRKAYKRKRDNRVTFSVMDRCKFRISN